LRYVEYLAERREAMPHALNFGPLGGETVTVSQIAEEISRRLGNIHPWRQAGGEFPPEKRELRLHSGLAAQTLGWRPRLDMAKTIAWTAQWYADFASGQDALALMRAQIAAYQA
jgi:CDP-glucose 4,6-dehydratase